ncbi:hypothetical protein [Sinorhizobium sp. CCBAU 05631]|uniref:hypothetical protein n=1 Tax=Sinorhizobium sp. CCBAU 05631 TaxID=794846 RepID=UPI001AEC0A4F|nr:hypothetical protein [Sinorhizobium sp. CCBAU 05631]
MTQGIQAPVALTWAGAARLSGPMGAAACTHDVSGHGRVGGSLAVTRRMPPQQGQTVGWKGTRRQASARGVAAGHRPAVA